jgi:adsorption protein B
LASFTALQWLEIVGHELLLFAAVWFAIGALDEMAVDLAWLRLRLTGRARTQTLDLPADAPLRGIAAVLVPAWREAAVIGAMVEHCLAVWPQEDLRIYAGCYRNDSETLAALVAAAPGDARLRIVVHDCDGPTTKADCLNRLHAALSDDERRCDFTARSVILHDAEDMVHPAALALLDRGLDDADFVQLPVRPEPQVSSPWIAGHYADEFAESHGKGLVVRDWLETGLPAAGVGCAFSRRAIRALAQRRGSAQPFAAECLTEDYESGLLVAEAGGRGRFLRVRDAEGALVATREFFPSDLGASVRQKTRWLHGIAFQGWDRLGWHGSLAELWMRMRDRRGPLIALVLSAGYLLVLIWPLLLLAKAQGALELRPVARGLAMLLWFNSASLLWRIAFRFAFTAREYGWRQGLLGILRMPVANIIAIMAGRRALAAYLRSLLGGRVTWEKTEHRTHPVLAGAR